MSEEEAFHQANLEMEHEICNALDRCLQAGADEESLKLLAWQAGVSYWKPNTENSNAAHE